MRLDVHGGGVVDAKAYKSWPGVVFNGKYFWGVDPQIFDGCMSVECFGGLHPPDN